MAALGALCLAGNGAHAVGPFDVLEWGHGVTTSRDGYSVWISANTTDYELAIPGHQGVLRGTNGPIALGARCRAHEQRPDPVVRASALHGGLTLEDHPAQGEAATFYTLRYWIQGLLGSEREHWAVTMRVGDNEPAQRTLTRRLTDYSIRNPSLEIDLDGEEVAGAFAANETIRIEGQGEGFRIGATFTPGAATARAAKLMLKHCPQA